MRWMLLVVLLAGCGAPVTVRETVTETVKVVETHAEAKAEPPKPETPKLSQYVPPSDPPLPPEPPLEFDSPNAIWSKYDKNVVAADLELTGKTVIFPMRHGTRIQKDSDGQYRLALTVIGSRMDLLNPPPGVTVLGIQCFMDKSALKFISNHQPGDLFKIRGTCRGRVATEGAWHGFYVAFDKCEILSHERWDKWDKKLVPVPLDQ